jgi:hypothetical protein
MQMERIVSPPTSDELVIVRSLLSAPEWARAGLASPGLSLRQHAALELARAVLKGGEAQQEVSPDQLALKL